MQSLHVLWSCKRNGWVQTVDLPCTELLGAHLSTTCEWCYWSKEGAGINVARRSRNLHTVADEVTRLRQMRTSGSYRKRVLRNIISSLFSRVPGYSESMKWQTVVQTLSPGAVISPFFTWLCHTHTFRKPWALGSEKQDTDHQQTYPTLSTQCDRGGLHVVSFFSKLSCSLLEIGEAYSIFKMSSLS